MQLLRGQYDREKRLLDEKVRQLAELESTQEDQKAMTKENFSLRRLNTELTKALKEERSKNDKVQQNLELQQKELGYKLQLIETGCGRELVLRLKSLRDEINTVSNKQRTGASADVSYSEDSVENMSKEIVSRVR